MNNIRVTFTSCSILCASVCFCDDRILLNDYGLLPEDATELPAGFKAHYNAAGSHLYASTPISEVSAITAVL